MSTDPDRDTSRTAVKAYVPAYQKDRWQEHAEELGMSQSEFVRTMVQAGRSSIELSNRDQGAPDGDTSPSADEGALRRRIVAALDGEQLSWEQLVEELTDGIEDRLETALEALQAENRVMYSGRHGGYVLVEGGDGD
jgi:hypothetical protein